MPASGGPWVQMAIFCENVIIDKEDVLTAIRIVDQVTLNVTGPTAPDEMPPIDRALKLVVALKAGEARGRGTVRVDMRRPDGGVTRGPEFSVNFHAEHQGHTILQDLRLQLQYEGVYWFDVVYGDQVMTRIPLRVVYQRISTSSGP